MDLKKEIKLKDLLPKRGSKVSTDAPAAEAKPAKSKRSLSFSRKAKTSGEQAEGQPAARRSRSSRRRPSSRGS